MSVEEERKIGCGFLVVRRPEYNCEIQAISSGRLRNGMEQQTFYHGIDRMRWFDLDKAFYSGALPSEICEMRKSVRAGSKDFTGIQVATDWSTAEKLLNAANCIAGFNELIIVESKRLAEIKGVTVELSNEVRWIGWDVVSLGNWSLIAGGIFVAPSAFLQWGNRLTEEGLLPSSTFVEELAIDYDHAAKQGIVEELPESPYGIEAIRVGLL